MSEKQGIRILHSVPSHDNKFRRHQELLFDLEQVENTFSETGLSNPSINLHDFDIIVIHYLREKDIQYLIHHKIDAPILWFSWGADMYILGKFYNSFVLKKTKKLRKKLAYKISLIYGIKTAILSLFPKSYDARQHHIDRIKAIQKIDYLINVMPGEAELLTSNYPFHLQSAHINLVVPTIEDEKIQQVNGRNILLGNSASYTNNHVEAIDWLCTFDLTDRKVIIPLSYGYDELANYVATYAKKKLGDRAVILRDFLPYEEYISLLNSCEIVVLNHLRQQAVGNVVQALLCGSNLYLRDESVVTHFLQKEGFVFQSIQQAKELKGLSPEEKKLNHEKAKREFGADNQHRKLNVLIDEILQR